jgi:(2Fe-2S) ferredoxin
MGRMDAGPRSSHTNVGRGLELKEQVFSLVTDVWRTEVSPAQMMEIAQIMLHKGKKSKEDRSGYRPISVTQAAYNS